MKIFPCFTQIVFSIYSIHFVRPFQSSPSSTLSASTYIHLHTMLSVWLPRQLLSKPLEHTKYLPVVLLDGWLERTCSVRGRRDEISSECYDRALWKEIILSCLPFIAAGHLYLIEGVFQLWQTTPTNIWIFHSTTPSLTPSIFVHKVFIHQPMLYLHPDPECKLSGDGRNTTDAGIETRRDKVCECVSDIVFRSLL